LRLCATVIPARLLINLRMSAIDNLPALAIVSP
jgi:hypothetical protein